MTASGPNSVDASLATDSTASGVPPKTASIAPPIQNQAPLFTNNQHQLTQLCFNRAQFTREDFNVDIFLTSVRRRATIEQIQQDLRVYLKIVQNSMIELINDDYADFVNLSSTLVNLRTTLDKVTHDYDQISSDFTESTADLTAASAKLTEVRHKITDNAEHQKLIGIKLKLYSLLDRQRLVLKRYATEASTSDNADASVTVDDTNKSVHFQQIRRITQLFQVQMQRSLLNDFQAGHAETPMELTSAIRKLANFYQRLLDREMSLMFKSDSWMFESSDGKISSKNVYVFAQLLEGYAACDRLDAAVNTMVIDCLQPRLDKNEGVLKQAKTVGKREKSSQLFVQILEWIGQIKTKFDGMLKVDDQCVQLSELTAHNLTLCQSICDRSLLTLLLARLDDARFKPVLIATDVNAFSTCLNHFRDFASKWLQSCALSDRANQSRILKLAFDKFNVSVYARLRLSEASTKCHSALTKSDLASLTAQMEQSLASKSSGGVFHFDASRRTIESMEWLWSPSVFLGLITDKLWTHTVKLANDYTKWVLAAVKSITTESISDNRASSAEPAVSSNAASTTPADTASTDAMTPAKKDKTANIRLAMALLSDACAIENRLMEVAFDVIWPSMRSVGVEDTSSFGRVLTSLGAQIQDAAKPAAAYVEKLLNDSLSACVNSVNEVPRAYRWTRKDPPTHPSAYVQHTATVWQDFITLSDQCRADVSMKDSIVIKTCRQAVEAYCTHVNNVLTTADKMSSSLSRLKKTAAAKSDDTTTGSASSTMSDDEKIRLQLHLDVGELTTVISRLLEASEDGDEAMMDVTKRMQSLNELTKPAVGN